MRQQESAGEAKMSQRTTAAEEERESQELLKATWKRERDDWRA